MNKELIIRMAREAGIAKHGLGWTCWEGQLERFAALVAAHEREKCAKVCEEGVDTEHPIVKGHIMKNFGSSDHLAEAIRARGEK